MKKPMQRLAWRLAVWLGLVEPPRLQPVPVRDDEVRVRRQRR